ncbi:MAG: hypothetical protein WD768_16815 [Phycisphaeraceae bacterium]
MGLDVNRAREWVNQNSAAVTIGAVVILIFSLAYLWFNASPGSGGGGNRGPIDQYFYDVNTQKLFVVSGDKLPPIPSPSAPNDPTKLAYKAYRFSCGDCSEAQQFTGYYEGFQKEYKDAIERAKEAARSGSAAGPEDMMFMEEGYGKGRLISTDAIGWVEQNSPEGIAINHDLSKKCGEGGRLRPCYPGMP